VCGEQAQHLRRAFERTGIATFVFARDAIGHDLAGAPYVDYVATWSNDVRVASSVFSHELWDSDDGVTAVVAVGSRADVHSVTEELARTIPRAVLVATFPMRRGMHTGQWAMIVRAAGGTKGTAMRWIAEYEGIALEDTVAVGDWINDVPMFEVAARSFAMGHAPDEVKRHATDVLPHGGDEGGGVAHAIERAFGIRVD
jgi:hydroxymethylpyrimidine pyrophosphatase-like HAD family hydrolase